MLFEKISKDKKIIDIYSQISQLEDHKKEWAHHNYEHVMNVAEMMRKIMLHLKYDEAFIDEALVAAILHDIGCLEGKENHPYRSYEFTKQYLITNNIKLNNELLVLEAIKNHSAGFDTDNIITLTLILCDKLDIKYTRLAKEGYKVNGIRQLQYIKDIDMIIEDNYLNINFVCEKAINLNELESFYFTKKLFKAIKSFSTKLNLIPKITINNDIWDFCIET